MADDMFEGVDPEIVGRVIQGYMQNDKADKIERFKRLNKFVKKGQILFAGSSLMEQFPIYEFLQDFDLPYTIYNRGVGGFTTTEMLPVMNECVYELEPAHIFLNIGTNDLNDEDYSEDALMGRYAEILDGIKARLPEAKLHLLAYYPVNPVVGAENPYMAEVFKHRTNERIASASRAVEALAARYGATFHNLNKGIMDADGNLKAEYTVEGMHFYADGYKAVLDELLPVLKSLE